MNLLFMLILVRLHLRLQLPLLQEEVAAAVKVLLQRQRQEQGLLWTRQPMLLPTNPLLHQEMSVFHWKSQHLISNLIPPCSILSTSFSPLCPHQGVAESCLWGGCQCHPLVASTWTAHLLLHLPPHPLHLHPLLHLLQGL